MFYDVSSLLIRHKIVTEHILYLIKHTRLSTTQQQAMPSMFQHARGSTNPSTLFTCAFKKQTKRRFSSTEEEWGHMTYKTICMWKHHSVSSISNNYCKDLTALCYMFTHEMGHSVRFLTCQRLIPKKEGKLLG